MALLGGVGELYLVSAGIGSCYLVISFLMGQIHSGGPAHDAGHAGGCAHGGPHVGDAGHGSAHAAGTAHSGAQPGSAPHGHAPALPHGPGGMHHGQAGAASPSGPANGQAGSDSASNLGHVHAEFHGMTGHHHAVHSQSGVDTGPVQALPRLASRAGRLLLTVLSPMTMATFLAFFGLSGLVLSSALPQFAIWTIVPAILIGLLVTRSVLSIMHWMMLKMNVTNVVRTNDLVGLMANVTVGFEDSTIGQVTFVAMGIRSNSLARAAQPGAVFKRGDRVMIVDIRDRIAYVQPWTDEFNPDDSEILLFEEKPQKEGENS